MEPSYPFPFKPGVLEALPYHHTTVPYEDPLKKDLEVYESSNDSTPICSSSCRSQSADCYKMDR